MGNRDKKKEPKKPKKPKQAKNPAPNSAPAAKP